MCACVCAQAHTCTYHSTYVDVRAQLVRISFLLLPHVSWDQTQVVSLSSKYCHTLKHLTSPDEPFHEGFGNEAQSGWKHERKHQEIRLVVNGAGQSASACF